jgi:CRISPR-associated protein Cas2
MNMIVAYDIADPLRLNRVAKVMKDYGLRVQKSIFEVEANDKIFEEMKSRAERVMVREKDGVKYFPLCDRCADTLITIGVANSLPDEGEYLIV